jgi:trehalose 6-phosphate synthase/phosphatase
MNLAVVSNRLPFVVSRGEGGVRIEPGSGGLVTALRPVLSDRGGRWVGWTGASDARGEAAAKDALAASRHRFGYDLVPVELTAAERDGFYHGFSNEVLWPLFHDLLPLCRFSSRNWSVYEAVNRKFAEVAARHCRPEDFLWVHDYHLLMTARELREIGVRSRLAFFLHIPFPAPDIFLKLPWRFAILRALLDFDLVGFQTMRDRQNFLHCLRLLVPAADVSGKGAVASARLEGREIRVGAFPIGIDVELFERLARAQEVEAKARSLRADEAGRKIVLGIDRLDYTKGIPEKLEAFRALLTERPEWRGKVTLFQVVVPSREDVPRYREHRTLIETLVGEINGRFTVSGWVPIHYIYRGLGGPRLPAYYLAADVAFVTPLKDGMNLVAKEYCAARVDRGGALVLSEFAGAAAQLQRGALLVNPFDVDGMAAALHRALTLRPAERLARMIRLRRAVRENDVYRWVSSFLEAAVSKDLEDFPRLPEYVPEVVAT